MGSRFAQKTPSFFVPAICFAFLPLNSLGLTQRSCSDSDDDGFSTNPACSSWADCDDHNGSLSPVAVDVRPQEYLRKEGV